MLAISTFPHHFKSNAASGVSLPRFRKVAVFCSRCVPSRSVNMSMPTNNVTMRVERINGYMTEVMEIQVKAPKLRVVFIPGNPGVISFYKSYLEALSHLLDGKANITGVSHVAHTAKDWDKGKLFSLEEQVEHKIQFVQNYNTDEKIPLILVGHSIGAHMALCVFKSLPDKVQHVVGLYPFLATNEASSFQSLLKWSLSQGFLCEALSYFAASMGKLPKVMSRGFLKGVFGRGWSPLSVNVACEYLCQYSLVRNITYMGMTEFKKVTKQAPHLDVEVEREGHDHAFCCTEAGSLWVAAFCAKTIKKVLPNFSLVLDS
eukprot:c23401_g1_i2 orf=78-1028(+)